MPDFNSPVTFINFILSLYTGGIVCLLLLALFYVARFYEQKSGQRSYYPIFLVAIVFVIIAVYRYSFVTLTLTGDIWGDIARFVAGSITIIFSLLLFKLMIGGRA